MTYVRQQTSEALATHMRYLQGLPGWHDPLADRLWQEVDELRAQIAGLKTGYEAYERVNAELKAECERLKTLRSTTERDLAQELEVWRHGPSCWNCGDTGDVHDIVGEWRGQCDCNAAKLIDVTSERDQLKADSEALRRDAERYRRMRAMTLAQMDDTTDEFDSGFDSQLDAAMGQGEQS